MTVAGGDDDESGKGAGEDNAASRGSQRNSKRFTLTPVPVSESSTKEDNSDPNKKKGSGWRKPADDGVTARRSVFGLSGTLRRVKEAKEATKEETEGAPTVPVAANNVVVANDVQTETDSPVASPSLSQSGTLARFRSFSVANLKKKLSRDITPNANANAGDHPPPVVVAAGAPAPDIDELKRLAARERAASVSRKSASGTYSQQGSGTIVGAARAANAERGIVRSRSNSSSEGSSEAGADSDGKSDIALFFPPVPASAPAELQILCAAAAAAAASMQKLAARERGPKRAAAAQSRARSSSTVNVDVVAVLQLATGVGECVGRFAANLYNDLAVAASRDTVARLKKFEEVLSTEMDRSDEWAEMFKRFVIALQKFFAYAEAHFKDLQNKVVRNRMMTAMEELQGPGYYLKVREGLGMVCPYHFFLLQIFLSSTGLGFWCSYGSFD